MNLPSVFLLAMGLAMDAFAVAVCAGLVMKKVTVLAALVIGLWFGAFQAAMPVIGYFIGNVFTGIVGYYSNIIAFVLLAFIGGKMIVESLRKDKPAADFSLKPAHMLPFALATSIDAMAVGVSFAFLYVNIILAALVIGVVTLGISMAGAFLGGFAGAKWGKWAQLAGGVVLILMGLRIFLE